jgi:hypothetical protein
MMIPPGLLRWDAERGVFVPNVVELTLAAGSPLVALLRREAPERTKVTWLGRS